MLNGTVAGEFLPYTRVTTVVWVEDKAAETCKWDSAQGDDLKNDRAAIEINLAKILRRCEPQEAALEMIKSWLRIYLILSTRQDLINKGIRSDVSEKGHSILYDANFKAIMESPALKRRYFILAVDCILGGGWFIADHFRNQDKGLIEEVKVALKNNIPS